MPEMLMKTKYAYRLLSTTTVPTIDFLLITVVFFLCFRCKATVVQILVETVVSFALSTLCVASGDKQVQFSSL